MTPVRQLTMGLVNIPAGDCDCDGNQLDALGVCGGSCEADADNDGICDDDPDSVMARSMLVVCATAWAIYDCGCSDIPASGATATSSML